MHATARPMSHGFTLVELLVVLTIMTGLLAIAIPEFAHLYARVRVASEQQELERQLLGMPERVRLTGRGGVLTGQGDTGLSTAAAIETASSPGFAYLEDGQSLALDLPADWTVAVPNPIVYHFTGACDGGEITFSLSSVSLRYVLNPPLCRPLLANAAKP